MSEGVKLRQTPVRLGRIERFERAFDRAADDADLSSPRFRDLETGDWGVRYYRPAAGKRPVALLVRVSHELQTQGDKVPFADQVKRMLDALPADAGVVAVYWDCQTAGDTAKRGAWIEQIVRPGFERCVNEACAGLAVQIWVFRSCRALRSLYSATRLEQAYKVANVTPHSATDPLPLEYLGVAAAMNAKDRENIIERTLTGRERRARRDGLPPSSRVPLGWRVAETGGHPKHRIEHDPEVMPVLRRMLAGLRFEGWTWGRAAGYLVTEGVRRQRRPEVPWADTHVRLAVLRHSWWLGATVVNLPGFSLETGRRSQRDADREALTLAVPGVDLDDPDLGPRPMTRADLEAIKRTAASRPGPGTHKGTSVRPLAGLLRCACCGWTLVARREPAVRVKVHRLRDGTVRRYQSRVAEPKWRYECPSAGVLRRSGKAACPRRPLRVREDALLDAIWDTLVDRLSRPEAATAEARAAVEALRRDPEAVSAAAAQERLAGLARREVAWHDKLDAGTCSQDAFDVKLADIRAEREAIRAEAQAAAGRAEELRQRERDYAASVAAAGRIDWARLGETLRERVAPAERAAHVRLLVDRVVVKPAGHLVVEVRWAGVARLAAAEGPGREEVVQPWSTGLHSFQFGNHASTMGPTFALRGALVGAPVGAAAGTPRREDTNGD